MPKWKMTGVLQDLTKAATDYFVEHTDAVGPWREWLRVATRERELHMSYLIAMLQRDEREKAMERGAISHKAIQRNIYRATMQTLLGVVMVHPDDPGEASRMADAAHDLALQVVQLDMESEKVWHEMENSQDPIMTLDRIRQLQARFRGMSNERNRAAKAAVQELFRPKVTDPGPGVTPSGELPFEKQGDEEE